MPTFYSQSVGCKPSVPYQSFPLRWQEIGATAPSLSIPTAWRLGNSARRVNPAAYRSADAHRPDHKSLPEVTTPID